MKKLRLSSQVRKAFQGRSRGFTLIEVLIAIALMGTIAITVLSALSTASLALITADKRATAESLARSQMEYVKNQIYEEVPHAGEATYDEITPIPDGYSICSVNRDDEIVNDVIGVPWDSEDNEPVDEDNGLQRIKLVIKRYDKVVITLEGYKRNTNIEE
jgi:prepilin-type N-terminal cleavage/methylation domain-containing protein